MKLKDQLPNLDALFSSLDIDLEKYLKGSVCFVNFWKHYDDAIGSLSSADLKIFREKIANFIPNHRDLDNKKWLQAYDLFDEVYVYSYLYKLTGCRPEFIKEGKEKSPDLKLFIGKKISIVEIKHISYSDKYLNDYNKLHWFGGVHPTFYKKIIEHVNKALLQINSYNPPAHTSQIFLIFRLDTEALFKPDEIIDFLKEIRNELRLSSIIVKLHIMVDHSSVNDHRFQIIDIN